MFVRPLLGHGLTFGRRVIPFGSVRDAKAIGRSSPPWFWDSNALKATADASHVMNNVGDDESKRAMYITGLLTHK